MAFARALSFRPGAADQALPASRTRPGFFGRLLRSVQRSRERQAERIIAEFIRQRGSRFSDSLERQIEDRFCR